MSKLCRASILPEPGLPDVAELLDAGRRMAGTITVGSCPFLTTHGVSSESDYKRRCVGEGSVMFHAQFGFRSPEKSQRAYGEIHERVEKAGYRVDRYGICLDWSMGYPAESRAEMPRGTGLILDSHRAFSDLTQNAPVAPHFGDFVIGTPAALENTVAALSAGATSIGNLGQYFTFRMPRWDDDVGTTAETVKAMALCAAQPMEILVHSNLDDGFAATFTDLACGIGAVLIERAIVEDLIGGRVSHCYGHVFSEPLSRLAFQRALARITDVPGTMVYGNTTIYGANEIENYANLASYLLVDLVAQELLPTGHGLNPVPVTEALRIPDIDEIVDAHLFANRLAERASGFEGLFDLEAADAIAETLVEGGVRFKEAVFRGLEDAGIDVQNPFELLLSIRRIGAKRLEELFGPGQFREGALRNRAPLVPGMEVLGLEARAEAFVSALRTDERGTIRRSGFRGCVTSTDVHEYGKLLVDAVLGQLGVTVIDVGVSADPDTVAARAKAGSADFIAVSTYSGIALEYLRALNLELDRVRLRVPIFIGGKLNQVPESNPSSLPEDVTGELRALGAVVCLGVEDMVEELGRIAQGRDDD